MNSLPRNVSRLGQTRDGSYLRDSGVHPLQNITALGKTTWVCSPGAKQPPTRRPGAPREHRCDPTSELLQTPQEILRDPSLQGYVPSSGSPHRTSGREILKLLGFGRIFFLFYLPARPRAGEGEN